MQAWAFPHAELGLVSLGPDKILPRMTKALLQGYARRVLRPNSQVSIAAVPQ